MKGLRRGDDESYDALDLEACVMRVMEARLEALRRELAAEPCAGCVQMRQALQQAAGVVLDGTDEG